MNESTIEMSVEISVFNKPWTFRSSIRVNMKPFFMQAENDLHIQFKYNK